MSLTLEDLQPKEKEITINGVQLIAKPLKLSHALILTQLGEIFQNPKNASVDEIKKAEKNVENLIGDVIPELSGKELDMDTTIKIISELMKTIQPSDNAELIEKGVSFNADPKAEKIG